VNAQRQSPRVAEPRRDRRALTRREWPSGSVAEFVTAVTISDGYQGETGFPTGHSARPPVWAKRRRRRTHKSPNGMTRSLARHASRANREGRNTGHSVLGLGTSCTEIRPVVAGRYGQRRRRRVVRSAAAADSDTVIPRTAAVSGVIDDASHCRPPSGPPGHASACSATSIENQQLKGAGDQRRQWAAPFSVVNARPFETSPGELWALWFIWRWPSRSAAAASRELSRSTCLRRARSRCWSATAASASNGSGTVCRSTSTM